MNDRKFTPYEYNQLNKYGFDPLILAKVIDSNIPIEYVTGKVEFKNTEFNVDSSVLIPRVETEQIIDIALEYIDSKDPVTYCDIGTGSGAIGISIALELLKRQTSFDCYLSDISSSALKIAKQNVDEVFTPKHQNCFTNKIDNSQIKVIESDLFDKYPKNKTFDLIISNLPYIPSERIQQLDTSVKDFEPVSALDGGIDGLKIIRELIQQSKLRLKKDGYIILEVDDVHTSAEEFSKDWNVQIKNDINNKNRFWILTKK